MMEMKKRPLVDDQEMGIPKKRAVASHTGSPIPVNGKADSGREEFNAENLESFRKEAIFRRMRHYSRENERAQDKIAELEKCRQVLEANVTAIGVCWEQLIQEVRLLVKPETLPAPDALSSDVHTIFELAGDPDSNNNVAHLSDSLRERGHATQQLIAAFVHLGPKAVPPESEELRKECSRLHRQVNTLRAELQTANSRIAKVEDDNIQYHATLLAAESRADRAQSASVQAMRTQSAVTATPEQEESKSDIKEEVVKVEEGEAKLLKLPSPPASLEQTITNGHETIPFPDDQQDWKAVYDHCDKKNQEMTEELLALRARCSQLELELASPSLDTLQKAPLYDALIQRFQFFKGDAETQRQRCSELTRQVNEMRELQEDYKEKLIADYGVRYDEQKTMLVKRDHEGARLREQRDALQAEVNEIRSRIAEKKSTAQFQTLLQSRADRIAGLELENKRLKAQLVANAGQQDLLELILGNKIDNLPERLAESEKKLMALQSSLATLDSTTPDVAQHIRSETEARELLATALKQVERFDSIFGPGSALPPDQAAMAKLLQEKDKQLRNVELQLQQERAASNDLISEIERISAAWEVLDRQNKTKIFDLDAMEVKLQKVSGEKAKADNKYFGAMRQKEAAEAERKAILRTVEKLQKAVERFNEAEKGFSSKLASREKELSVSISRGREHEEAANVLERKSNEQQWRYDDMVKQFAEMKRQLLEAHTRLEQYRMDTRRLEEDNVKIRKEVERHSAKASAVSSGKVTTREMDLEQKYDKCMKLLRCSTCKQNLRSHVLTKCMHSFCKECVQARIDTRQRKCPACNMGFSQGEFQQLYFQG